LTITYSLGEKNQKETAVNVVFYCKENNSSITRLINIPKFMDGSINEDLFNIILEKQLIGIEREFNRML